MGIIQRGADLFYTFRFIKLLVTQWVNTDAYKLGIIDAQGNPLKKVSELSTDEEKSSYTMFHRLVYNIKRIIQKTPLVGQTRLASWAAALWLIKEETGISEQAIIKLMEKYAGDNEMSLDTTLYESNTWLTESDGSLRKGSYTLLSDVASPKTGEMIARSGTSVIVYENTQPVGSIFGANIYYVEHVKTRQNVYVSIQDIVK